MDAEKALSVGLGLKPAHWRILIRVGWVLIVSLHIAHVRGWLIVVGIASPYASASDVDKLLRASEVNARISMQQELRVQVRLWCTTPDAEIRSSALHRIDELRNDLRDIAKVETTEPTCTS